MLVNLAPQTLFLLLDLLLAPTLRKCVYAQICSLLSFFFYVHSSSSMTFNAFSTAQLYLVGSADNSFVGYFGGGTVDSG